MHVPNNRKLGNIASSIYDLRDTVGADITVHHRYALDVGSRCDTAVEAAGSDLDGLYSRSRRLHIAVKITVGHGDRADFLGSNVTQNRPVLDSDRGQRAPVTCNVSNYVGVNDLKLFQRTTDLKIAYDACPNRQVERADIAKDAQQAASSKPGNDPTKRTVDVNSLEVAVSRKLAEHRSVYLNPSHIA